MRRDVFLTYLGDNREADRPLTKAISSDHRGNELKMGTDAGCFQTFRLKDVCALISKDIGEQRLDTAAKKNKTVQLKKQGFPGCKKGVR